MPLLTSLICMLPLLVLHDRFQTLYWFHDDWDLTSEMQSLSTLGWMAKPFGENFAPVFKLAWKGAILAFHGSYFSMILLLWGVHLGILLLLAGLVRRCGLDSRAQSLAVLTLGLSWSNIESLGWAACLVSLLPDFFFLAAWVLLLDSEARGGSNGRMALAVACALASGFSFSRGVLTGALLAFFLLHSARSNPGGFLRVRWRTVAFTSVTLISLIPYRWMPREYGNFQGVDSDRLAAMVSYGAHYWLLSPLYPLLPMPHKTVGPTALLIAGGFKVLFTGLGLALTKDRLRSMLVTLLLLDLGMAAMLGLGRFQLPLDTAVSSRYQHLALLCFAPYFAIVVLRGLQLFRAPQWRTAAFAIFICAWALLLGFPWLRQSQRWSGWRGSEVRAALAASSPEERFGLPAITAGRARQLIEIYGLH